MSDTSKGQAKMSNFGHTEMFRLRHSLVTLIEELKVRKRCDASTEAKIQELVNQNHVLQRSKDSDQQRAKLKEEGFERAMEDLKQQYEEKLRRASIDQQERNIKKETIEFVEDRIKDEMRQLQMSIYHQEKTIKELEAKLQSQKSFADKALSQFTEIEAKMASLTELYQSTQQSVTRLERDVTKARAINTKLAYENQHHKCQMKEKMSELGLLQKELLTARIEKSSLTEEQFRLSELRTTEEKLQRRILVLEEEKADLHAELERQSHSLKSTLSNLQTAQGLVSRHLDNTNKSRAETDLYAKECQDLTARCSHLSKQLVISEEKLHQQIQALNAASDKWAQKEYLLEAELQAQLEQLQTAKESAAVLTEQRSHLSKMMQTMSQELAEAQAKLDVPKLEKDVQTGCAYTDRTIQCSPQCSSVAAQTVGAEMCDSQSQTGRRDTASSCIQTNYPLLTSSTVQTFVWPVSSHACQTIELMTVHKSVQTESFIHLHCHMSCTHPVSGGGLKSLGSTGNVQDGRAQSALPTLKTESLEGDWLLPVIETVNRTVRANKLELTRVEDKLTATETTGKSKGFIDEYCQKSAVQSYNVKRARSGSTPVYYPSAKSSFRKRAATSVPRDSSLDVRRNDQEANTNNKNKLGYSQCLGIVRVKEEIESPVGETLEEKKQRYLHQCSDNKQLCENSPVQNNKQRHSLRWQRSFNCELDPESVQPNCHDSIHETTDKHVQTSHHLYEIKNNRLFCDSGPGKTSHSVTSLKSVSFLHTIQSTNSVAATTTSGSDESMCKLFPTPNLKYTEAKSWTLNLSSPREVSLGPSRRVNLSLKLNKPSSLLLPTSAHSSDSAVGSVVSSPPRLTETLKSTFPTTSLVLSASTVVSSCHRSYSEPPMGVKIQQSGPDVEMKTVDRDKNISSMPSKPAVGSSRGHNIITNPDSCLETVGSSDEMKLQRFKEKLSNLIAGQLVPGQSPRSEGPCVQVTVNKETRDIIPYATVPTTLSNHSGRNSSFSGTQLPPEPPVPRLDSCGVLSSKTCYLNEIQTTGNATQTTPERDEEGHEQLSVKEGFSDSEVSNKRQTTSFSSSLLKERRLVPEVRTKPKKSRSVLFVPPTGRQSNVPGPTTKSTPHKAKPRGILKETSAPPDGSKRRTLKSVTFPVVLETHMHGLIPHMQEESVLFSTYGHISSSSSSELAETDPSEETSTTAKVTHRSASSNASDTCNAVAEVVPGTPRQKGEGKLEVAQESHLSCQVVPETPNLNVGDDRLEKRQAEQELTVYPSLVPDRENQTGDIGAPRHLTRDKTKDSTNYPARKKLKKT